MLVEPGVVEQRNRAVLQVLEGASVTDFAKRYGNSDKGRGFRAASPVRQMGGQLGDLVTDRPAKSAPHGRARGETTPAVRRRGRRVESCRGIRPDAAPLAVGQLPSCRHLPPANREDASLGAACSDLVQSGIARCRAGRWHPEDCLCLFVSLVVAEADCGGRQRRVVCERLNCRNWQSG